MIITIARPIGFSKIGGRATNEDAIYPLENEANSSNRLLVVCDGMGGHSSGEIASRIASISFATYLHTNSEADSFQSADEICRFWDAALHETELSFDEYLREHPESVGMGTTLCFLYIHSFGITLGHIGDSRIYQIRENKIIFKTEDHSLVNEMLKSGEITAEEAINYPGKNIITRAIQGKKTPAAIEFDLITDIQKGDYFFMCTDGVLEQINDRILEEILSVDYSVEEKVGVIVEKCHNLTKDNYSGYLLEIERVENVLPVLVETSPVLFESSVEETDENPQANLSEASQVKVNATKTRHPFFAKTRDILIGLGYGLGGAFIFLLGYSGYDYFSAEPKADSTPIVRESLPATNGLKDDSTQSRILAEPVITQPTKESKPKKTARYIPAKAKKTTKKTNAPHLTTSQDSSNQPPEGSKKNDKGGTKDF